MNEVVRALAEKTGRHLMEVEELWRRCRKEARLRGHSKDYALATALLKSRLGLSESTSRTLKKGSRVTYKGMSGVIETTTPDTALIKISKPNNSDIGKVIKAAGGYMAVPILDLEETTTALAVGTAPIATLGAVPSKRKGARVGSSVKMKGGKKGVVQAAGPDYSIVSLLDVHGNPTGKTRRIKNSLLRQLSESADMKEEVICGARRIAEGGLTATELVDELLGETIVTEETIRRTPPETRKPVAEGRYTRMSEQEIPEAPEDPAEDDRETKPVKQPKGEGALDATDLDLISRKEGEEAEDGEEEPIPAAAAIVAPDATPGAEEPVPEEELPPALVSGAPDEQLPVEGSDETSDEEWAKKVSELPGEEDSEEKPAKKSAEEPEEEEGKPKQESVTPRLHASNSSVAGYIQNRVQPGSTPPAPQPQLQPQVPAAPTVGTPSAAMQRLHEKAVQRTKQASPGADSTVSTEYGDMSERKLDRMMRMRKHISRIQG